jgi:hypothetical protein
VLLLLCLPPLHGVGNRPHKAEQFTGNCCDNFLLAFAFGPQSPEATAEPGLGLPGDRTDGRRQVLLPQANNPPDPRRQAVLPGGLHQRPTGMGVAGLGHAAPPGGGATRRFARSQADKGHEWSGVVKAGEITQFGDHGGRHDELHAAQGLQGLDLGAIRQL